MVISLKWAVLAALAATGTVGMAQNLAERDKIAQDKVQLAEYAKRVNSNCGTYIQFSIDYASYNRAQAGPDVRRQLPT